MRRDSVWFVGPVVVAGLLATSTGYAQKQRMKQYHDALRTKMSSMMKDGWKCQVNLVDSHDGPGQDVELRLTMPIHAFMEFASVAALEAASIPHKFPVVYIFVREETTDRVGRIAFVDAEPIAGRYLAGDTNAVNEMKEAIIWH